MHNIDKMLFNIFLKILRSKKIQNIKKKRKKKRKKKIRVVSIYRNNKSIVDSIKKLNNKQHNQTHFGGDKLMQISNSSNNNTFGEQINAFNKPLMTISNVVMSL